MAKFTYIINKTNDPDCREASKIEFTVPDDMNITEFKTICKRMAYSMGYADASIRKEFDCNSNSVNDKNLIKDIIKPDKNYISTDTISFNELINKLLNS
jgi:hypothetical protein